MISHELAAQLAPLLTWTPANGDRFYIPRPEIADSVFTGQRHGGRAGDPAGESRFHFNGTVEWALDSVESDGVVWLPREDQLRELLATTSCRWTPPRRVRGHVSAARAGPSTPSRADAADAYARALLYVRAASCRSAGPAVTQAR